MSHSSYELIDIEDPTLSDEDVKGIRDLISSKSETRKELNLIVEFDNMKLFKVDKNKRSLRKKLTEDEIYSFLKEFSPQTPFGEKFPHNTHSEWGYLSNYELYVDDRCISNCLNNIVSFLEMLPFQIGIISMVYSFRDVNIFHELKK
tara:strand:+ start:121 stop:561 length:441 start_codon:yes stop_codon:yes gene_type:complete